jgi:hypothetical protein
MKNMLWAVLAVSAAASFTIYFLQQENKKKLEERQRSVEELETVRAPQHAMG